MTAKNTNKAHMQMNSIVFVLSLFLFTPSFLFISLHLLCNFADGFKRCENAQFDMVIILDASTSVNSTNWSKVLSATKELINHMYIDEGWARVGVVVFSNDARPAFYLNSFTNKVDMLYNVSNIQYTYGQTNTAAALWLMRTRMFTEELGDRRYVPNVAVVITDGISTVNSERTIPEAKLAHDEGIDIFAIGIGEADRNELDAISGSKKRTYFVDKFDDLEKLMATVYVDFCPGKIIYLIFCMTFCRQTLLDLSSVEVQSCFVKPVWWQF